MKRTLMVTLLLMLLLATGTAYGEAPAYALTMDGIPMDPAIQGRMLGDAAYNILYVPLRLVAETAGLTVNWLPASGEVSISDGNSLKTVVPQRGAPDCWCAEPPVLIGDSVWVSGSYLARDLGILMTVQDHTAALQTGKLKWVDVPAGSYSLVLDVRNPEEYAAGHLEGAVLIPVAQLAERLHALENYRNEPILVYCKKGARSAQAAALLRQYGFENVCILKDGYDGWLSAKTH